MGGPHWQAAAYCLWEAFFCVGLCLGLIVLYRERANRKAEEARARSEELAARLQEANRRLKVYAERAEEVATAQERTRLARELHDAVTQTVFSMNLDAELFISEKTVKTHASNVLDKLGLADRTQAAFYAVKHGLA